MAFWKQKTAPTSVPTPAATPRKPVEVVASPSARVAHLRTGRSVLVRPHLTEKSSVLAERRQYTFLVTPDAEKISIARDVAARYGVHPVRVHIIRLPGKRVRSGKISGQRSGVKKAIVTLKEGEKLPFGVKS